MAIVALVEPGFPVQSESNHAQAAHKLARTAYLYGAILMLFAVAFGAFGAHALEQQLIADGRMDVYRTASHYHFSHALGLLAVGAIAERQPELVFVRGIINLLLSGVLIFSGSLYLLALLNSSWLGAITPIGGVCMIVGWGLLIVSLSRQGANQ